MEAKDTRMSLRDLHADKYWEEEDPYHSFANIEKIALDQAEISFRAGVREVLVWLKPFFEGVYPDIPDSCNPKLMSRVFGINCNEWQAKLKEWGVEDV